MYFPYFYARPAERDALIDAAPHLGTAQKVHPILEPWSHARDLTALLDVFAAQNQQLHIIVNPSGGDLQTTAAQAAWASDMRSRIGLPALVTPTWKVTRSTTLADLGGFAAAYPGRRIAVVVWDTLLTPTSIASALGNANVMLFVGPSLPVADFDAVFGLARVVELAQRFTVLTNKDYPAATTFSSDPKGYLVGGRAGFGDFTILKPGAPQKGGGGAGAVAVHMTYQDAATNDLIVQHFLSTDRTMRTPKDGIKLLQAIEKLHIQQTVTTPGRFRSTPGYSMLDDYRKRKHPTTLAKSKHAQLSHHLCTLAAAL